MDGKVGYSGLIEVEREKRGRAGCFLLNYYLNVDDDVDASICQFGTFFTICPAESLPNRNNESDVIVDVILSFCLPLFVFLVMIYHRRL